jgi:hypothetical protein
MKIAKISRICVLIPFLLYSGSCIVPSEDTDRKDYNIVMKVCDYKLTALGARPLVPGLDKNQVEILWRQNPIPLAMVNELLRKHPSVRLLSAPIISGVGPAIWYVQLSIVSISNYGYVSYVTVVTKCGDTSSRSIIRLERGLLHWRVQSEILI